jgi:tetratricopeptide (TPR) repeat protein
MELDPDQVLSRPQQLEIANCLAQSRRYEAAAAAYEAFLVAYPGASDAAQVRLFLGLIYSRYLQLYDRAAQQLRQALEGLQLDAQRTLAEEELRQATARLLGRDEDEQ